MYDFLSTENSYEDCVSLLKPIDSPLELLKISRAYNWDDGMNIPQAIIDHPTCDLGLALHLFELAEVVWLEKKNSTITNEWARFCSDLSDRILNSRYSSNLVSFESEYGKVQIHKMKKAGIPPIFLTPINCFS